MKTWEMIKELTENPNKIFQTKFADGIVWEAFNINGAIRCIFGKGLSHKDTDFLSTTMEMLNRDWEEVKQSVDFMTAFNARQEGKIIQCKMDNSIYTYKPNDNVVKFYETEISRGIWYICD